VFLFHSSSSGSSELIRVVNSIAVTTIFALDGLFSGEWLLDKGKDVTLTGGYRADYGLIRNGFTVLNGKLTVQSGSRRVDGMKVRAETP
jgi:hypothetical protein